MGTYEWHAEQITKNIHITWHADPVCLWHRMRNRKRNRRRPGLLGAELRYLPGQLWRWWGWWRLRRHRRVSCRVTAEWLHLYGSQTLFPQPLLLAALQPALQEAAEAAQHDDDGPDQPEAGETGQEGVGALRHHHGGDRTGWEFPLRQEEVISDEQDATCCEVQLPSSLQGQYNEVFGPCDCVQMC